MGLNIVNQTSFKKGHSPWNKGTKGIMKAWNKGLKGRQSWHNVSGLMRSSNAAPWNKGLKGFMANEKHGSWKGDSVGYNALHTWVQRNLGKATWCSHCMSTVNIQWASISHKAKRDLEDYISLCGRCHAKYDDYVNKSWEAKRRNKLFLS